MDISRKLMIAAALSAMALTACMRDEVEQKKKPDQGRAETKGISAVDNVGYAGTAVRKKVDKALDANDQRKDQLDQAIEQQSQ